MSRKSGDYQDNPKQHNLLSFDASKSQAVRLDITSIRIEIYELKILKDFKINDFSPYFVISNAKEVKKTGLPKEQNVHLFSFNEVPLLFSCLTMTRLLISESQLSPLFLFLYSIKLHCFLRTKKYI
jgi:hypothetical protein